MFCVLAPKWINTPLGKGEEKGWECVWGKSDSNSTAGPEVF